MQTRLWIVAALLAAVSLFAVDRPLSGQTPAVEPGARLRVEAEGEKVEGWLARLSADSLSLRMEGGETDLFRPAERHFSLLRVDAVEQEVRKGSAGQGAVTGLMAGAVIGIAMGRDTTLRKCFGPCFDTSALVGLAAGGGLGALFGAMIGAAVPRTTWEEVPLERE